ncbi:MAG TPA: enoyl-ACP reductase FabI [Acidimicrobiales bacterium]|nr:enoyl-ACP reductase FabI [Acidimicrobiales bacterium]
MGLLEGKKILVTGVLNHESIAYAVAEQAQQQGAELLLTSFGRITSITERAARRLPDPPDILELDVSNDEDFNALQSELQSRWGQVDGVVHAIANVDKSCLDGNFLNGPWADIAAGFRVSTYSLVALANATAPLMPEGGSIVGLDFDATVAWPSYDWMGVNKAGLESAARYLAKYLGPKKIRVNLVSAGPLRTVAARGVGAIKMFDEVWADRAPLGWDGKDTVPAGKAVVALLSDWFPATTGEIIHVDGGCHAIGA